MSPPRNLMFPCCALWSNLSSTLLPRGAFYVCDYFGKKAHATVLSFSVIMAFAHLGHQQGFDLRPVTLESFKLTPVSVFEGKVEQRYFLALLASLPFWRSHLFSFTSASSCRHRATQEGDLVSKQRQISEASDSSSRGSIRKCDRLATREHETQKRVNMSKFNNMEHRAMSFVAWFCGYESTLCSLSEKKGYTRRSCV